MWAIANSLEPSARIMMMFRRRIFLSLDVSTVPVLSPPRYTSIFEVCAGEVVSWLNRLQYEICTECRHSMSHSFEHFRTACLHLKEKHWGRQTVWCPCLWSFPLDCGLYLAIICTLVVLNNGTSSCCWGICDMTTRTHIDFCPFNRFLLWSDCSVSPSSLSTVSRWTRNTEWPSFCLCSETRGREYTVLHQSH